MKLEQLVKSGLADALKSLFNLEFSPENLALQQTRKEFDGQLTHVVFPYTKAAGKSPEETGKLIGEYLVANVQEIAGFNVVKGFLNMVIAEKWWLNNLKEIAETSSFGQHSPNGETVVVEFSSPNTNKPMHLGHLRNNFLGASISNILEAAGYKVIKANLINDRGIHICKSMLAYQLYGNDITPELAGIKGDHLIGNFYVAFDILYKAQIEILKKLGKTEEEAKKQAPAILEAQKMLVKWEAGDPEIYGLWKRLNSWVMAGFMETYKTIGVSFDKFYAESDSYLPGKKVVMEGLAEGVFFQKPDGSIWINLEGDGLDQKLVLRGDGTSVYITQDIGLADMKYRDFNASKYLYVVGNEQEYHFKVLFLILQKLNRPYSHGLHHLSYGMVDLPSGKMKSREGTVVDADDLITEMVSIAKERTSELGKIADFSLEEENNLYHILGLGAVKYFLLKVDPKKRMLFNPDESIELQGNTATAIQYTYARIRSIERKAAQMEILPAISEGYTLHPSERDIIILLTQFPDRILEAANAYEPSLIAQYAYDLAKTYNSFFAELSIFNAETPEQIAFRVLLSAQTGKVIKKATALLGIEVPERM